MNVQGKPSGGHDDERTLDRGATATVSKAYIHEMLEFNPMWDSSQIIRRRRELWGGESVAASASTAAAAGAVPHDPEADTRLRERARQCLEKLQNEFYQLPKEKLYQYLRILQSNRLPEYAAVAARLRAAADVRDTLLHANSETGDVKFAYSLQQSVVRPAAQGAVLREQYIESICDERRARPACAIIRKYVTAHPAVYALERNWFDMLLDAGNQNSWSSRHARQSQSWNLGSGRTKGGVSVAFIALLVIIRMVSFLYRPTDHRPASYTPPRPAPYTPHRPVPSSMAPPNILSAPEVADPNQAFKAVEEVPRMSRDLLDRRPLPPTFSRQNAAQIMERHQQELLERMRSGPPDWNSGMSPDPFLPFDSPPPPPFFRPPIPTSGGLP